MGNAGMLVRIAVVSTLWLGSLFVLFPRLAMHANEQLGWPRWEQPLLQVGGWLLIVLGVVVLLYALYVFRTEGEGTPVPTDPPRQLVSSGLYRFTRNPIFLADVAIVIGLFLVRGHLALLLYAGLVFAGLHLFLLWHEEPLLERRFGAGWQAYTRSVPRWLGR